MEKEDIEKFIDLAFEEALKALKNNEVPIGAVIVNKEKIVVGKLTKNLKESTLLGQEFVKDTEVTVEVLLDSSNAKVEKFYRYELGEGLEKRNDDFVEEVLAQAKGIN